MLKNLLTRLIDVRTGERTKVWAMALFLFLTMATFWALKPMKRGLLISYHKAHALELFSTHLGGAQAEQLAKVVNVFAALLLAISLSFLSRRLAPRYIILLLCSLFIVAFLAFAGLLGSPGIGTVWSFYVFGDMFNMLMVTLCWMMMNDSVEVGDAKRLFGIVGLGGVLGGMFGATIWSSSVATLGREPVLLLCIVTTVIMAIIGFLFARRSALQPTDPVKSVDSLDDALAAPSGFAVDSSLFRGVRLLASSKYLLAIGLQVAFYEIASSIVDFQLSATIERHVTEELQRDQYFGFVAQVQSVTAIFLQLFLTSFVMKRFGVGRALLVLPVVFLFGSVGFMLLPTLAFATLMSVGDNSMNYSINQSAKETLYVPTTPEEKYQAKAFIDMFVQRFAKVIAVGLNLGLVAYAGIEQVRWLSLASILMLILWIGVIRFSRRRFDRLAGAPPKRILEAHLARFTPSET